MEDTTMRLEGDGLGLISNAGALFGTPGLSITLDDISNAPQGAKGLVIHESPDEFVKAEVRLNNGRGVSMYHLIPSEGGKWTLAFQIADKRQWPQKARHRIRTRCPGDGQEDS